MWISLWKWFPKPSSSTSLQRYWIDLSNETSILTILQPYQKLWVLKCNFHTFLKPGVGFYYDGFENHQTAPRYEGIVQTILMSYLYRQSGNPIRNYLYLIVIFILFLSRVSLWKWFPEPSNSTSLQRYWINLSNETSILIIWQSYQKLWELK